MSTIQIAPLKYENNRTIIDCGLFIHIRAHKFIQAIEDRYKESHLTGVTNNGYFYIKKIISPDELTQLIKRASKP